MKVRDSSVVVRKLGITLFPLIFVSLFVGSAKIRLLFIAQIIFVPPFLRRKN
jgi:hypothetical protein